MLDIKNLSLAFGPHQVLQNLSLNLPKGEIGALIGHSGSGKTTLFKILTGMLPFYQGTFSINQYCSPKAHKEVSYMMQEDLLLPWRTVIDNLTLIGELGRNPKSNIYEAQCYLEEVGLGTYSCAYPSQLSGGMRQRVSLARALMQKKPLILLDEPFGSLDAFLREQMYDLLRNIQNKYGSTIMMITHDFRDALSLSNRIFLLFEGSISKEWIIDHTFHGDLNQQHALYVDMKSSLRT